MSEILEERIRLNAPGLASGYYLEIHQKGGEVVRYPKVGAFSLKPFCAPTGTPFGTYNLFFVRYPTDRQPLPPANPAEPYPRVQIPSSRKSALDHAISQFQTGDTPVAETAAGQEVEVDEDMPLALDQMADLEIAIASTPAMITARADYEKQRMAMELAENNQELLNKGNFSRDAAEALALNRAYRREAQVTIEAQAHLSRRTAEEVQSHWTAFRLAQEAQAEGMRLLKEQLTLFAKPAPPPPPIDYTPAIVEGLKTVRDFGVALMQTRAGIPLAPPQAAPSALPNQSTTAKLVPEPAPEAEEQVKAAPAAAPTSAPEPAPTPAPSPVLSAEEDVFAVYEEFLYELAPETSSAPTVSPVASVSAPTVTAARGVIDPASVDAKAEATRLIQALAETSEIEAMLALMNPEQTQAFLKRLRRRAELARSRQPSPGKNT